MNGKINLPEGFLIKMKDLLGEEYEKFLESYDLERAYGMRLNPLKVEDTWEIKRLAEKAGLRRVPWVREGYYYEKHLRPGRHSFHDAGVYYIQEPSAMAVVELLDPRPGDRILDLCAAPGGKTTQIAGKLLGEGLLLSNEIHPSRAKILSQNVERMGIANAVVSNESVKNLADRFLGFFNKIVVDAPCSGEGMFRKDQEARNQWSQENVVMCAERQKEILDYAACMLCSGGRLVYSTCTFSPEENEGSIQGFLKRNPQFFVEKVESYEGFSKGRPEWIEGGQKELENTFRIWPHKVEGEGHFVAVLKKEVAATTLKERKQKMPDYVKDSQVKTVWRKFTQETFTEEGLKLFGKEEEQYLVLFGEQLYLSPKEMPDYKGLKILRAGLHLGSLKKGRFEPSHSLALFLKKEYVKQWEAREAESKEIEAYLRGETLQTLKEEGSSNGWVLMLAERYPIGWAKRVGSTLKNHYPKGLRHI